VMSQTTLSRMTTFSPLRPDANGCVNAISSEFEWRISGDRTSVRLQIGGDPEMSTLWFDAEVGECNEISLQGLLPVSDRMLYWRVGDASGMTWSRPVPFFATSDQAYADFMAAQARHVQEETERAERAVAAQTATLLEVEVEHLWKTSSTSRNEALTIVAVMLAGFMTVLALTVIFHS
jgi:hypothetical protein